MSISAWFRRRVCPACVDETTVEATIAWLRAQRDAAERAAAAERQRARLLEGALMHRERPSGQTPHAPTRKRKERP